MSNNSLSPVSRRRFIVSAGFGVAAVAFAPRLLFSQNKGGLVSIMLDEAKGNNQDSANPSKH